MVNVISADSDVDKHYRHTGFSSTITDSYASPDSYARGITWDGTNVISADSSADKHYKHTGFSSTITDSYTAPHNHPEGITWDGRYSAEGQPTMKRWHGIPGMNYTGRIGGGW